MAIVKVKKTKKNGWLGVKSFANGKTRVGVAIDKQGNQVTGLTKEDEIRLEDVLGFPKGYLRKMNLRELEKAEPNYWVDYTIDFHADEILVLDTEIPEQEIQYLVLKAQKKVAKNLAELKTNGFAEFVIFDEEDEAVKDNVRGKNKRKATNLFDELATSDMKNILMLYGRPTESTSPGMIENQLWKLVEDDPLLFLSYATDPQLKAKVFILELVRAGILAKKGGAFTEYGSENILAYSMDEMVKFLDAKVNNAKVIQFKEALKDRF